MRWGERNNAYMNDTHISHLTQNWSLILFFPLLLFIGSNFLVRAGKCMYMTFSFHSVPFHLVDDNIYNSIYILTFFMFLWNNFPSFLPDHHRPCILQRLFYFYRFTIFIIMYAVYASSHHLFSSRTWASSSGEKSLVMLKVARISSGVLPLIIDATVAQVRSNSGLISM